MTNNEFYVMTVDYRKNYAEMITDLENVHSTPCPLCGARDLSKKISARDIYKCHFIGKKFGDFYQDISGFVVSKKFIDAMYAENISGFETRDFICSSWLDRRDKPVEVDLEYYKELRITGKGGYVVKNTGEIMDKCDKCHTIGWSFRYDLTGLGVGPDWDGSDMFLYKNFAPLIVTEKVKAVVEKYKLKNIMFKQLSTYRPGLDYTDLNL